MKLNWLRVLIEAIQQLVVQLLLESHLALALYQPREERVMVLV